MVYINFFNAKMLNNLATSMSVTVKIVNGSQSFIEIWVYVMFISIFTIKV